MSPLNPTLRRVLSALVTLAVPLALILSVVRLMLTPAFVQIEYRMPNFPQDSYGFTREDRLKWAPIALEYLLNDADISYLGDLQFEDGSPLYNPRELRHMQDVKNLTQAVLKGWYALLASLVVLGLWAWRAGWLWAYKAMLASGGRLTVALIGLLIVGLLVSFNQVFVGFHRIFFEGDTWLFRFSDTLIRLFPLRFWQDVFLIIAALTLAGGGGLWYFLGRGGSEADSWRASSGDG